MVLLPSFQYFSTEVAPTNPHPPVIRYFISNKIFQSLVKLRFSRYRAQFFRIAFQIHRLILSIWKSPIMNLKLRTEAFSKCFDNLFKRKARPRTHINDFTLTFFIIFKHPTNRFAEIIDMNEITFLFTRSNIERFSRFEPVDHIQNKLRPVVQTRTDCRNAQPLQGIHNYNKASKPYSSSIV